METMYQITESGMIRCDFENGMVLYLPAEDNGTPEWQEYQVWLDAGNTPEPYVEVKQPELTLKDKLAAMGIDLAELKATLEAL